MDGISRIREIGRVNSVGLPKAALNDLPNRGKLLSGHDGPDRRELAQGTEGALSRELPQDHLPKGVGCDNPGFTPGLRDDGTFYGVGGVWISLKDDRRQTVDVA
jgi:hypothetical protein